MPFISKYKQSNSSPFGLGPDMSMGSSSSSAPSLPGTVLGSSSCTCPTIFGYFFESHRKSAGTPMSSFRFLERRSLQMFDQGCGISRREEKKAGGQRAEELSRLVEGVKLNVFCIWGALANFLHPTSAILCKPGALVFLSRSNFFGSIFLPCASSMHATMASLFRPALSSARLQAERLCVGGRPSSMRLTLRPAQSARIAAPFVRRTYATSSPDPTPTPPPGPPGGSSREEKAKDREAIGVSPQCILCTPLFSRTLVS